MAIIHLITGPMFSGKSTNMVLLAKNYEHQGLKVCWVKHARDIRGNNSGITQPIMDNKLQTF